jgi:hypothetical protein
MNAYALAGILTFSDADFKRYTAITALHPASVLD